MVLLKPMVGILHRNVPLLSSLRLALLSNLELPPQLVWGQLIVVEVVHVGCRIGINPDVLGGVEAGGWMLARMVSQPKQTLEAGVDSSNIGLGMSLSASSSW